MQMLSRGSVLLILSIFLFAAAGHAQEPDPTPEPAIELENEVVPVQEIPKQSEALQRTLRRFTEDDPHESRIEAIASELPETRSRNTLDARHAIAVLEGSVTLSVLSDLERDWIPRLRALRSWRRTLENFAESLEDKSEFLNNQRAIWERSLESALKAEAPIPVLASARDNLSTLEKSSKLLQKERKVILELLTAASTAEREVLDLLERISKARALLRDRVFESGSEPLWTAIATADPEFALTRVRDDTLSKWTELRASLKELRDSLAPIFIVFLGAMGFAVYARKKLLSLTLDDRLEGSASVLQRPFSVAFVVTTFIASLASPATPQLLRDFVGVVLILPLIRVLVPIMPTISGKLVGALSLFYLADRVRGALVSAVVLERIIFLGEMVAVTAVLWSLLRPSRLAEVPPSSAPSHYLGIALKIAMVAFIISAGANVLGYVELAKLLGEGTLNSIYMGIVVYAGFRIATMFFVILLFSPSLSAVGVIRRNSDRLVQTTQRALSLAAGVIWSLAMLDGFAIREPVIEGLKNFLWTSYTIGTLSISLADLLAFPLTIAIAFFLSRAIRAVLEEDVFTRVSLGRGVGNAISTSVHYALLLGGFLIALGASGIDLTRFSLLAGALGVGIGFGLQDIVNNFISGLILLFERPIKIGDTIELGGLLGDVKRIGIRSSTVTTFQGAEVVIPNGKLLSEQLINWTLSNKHRRIELPVGVSYGNTPKDVIEVLKGVLQRETRILSHPEPAVLFRAFGDSSLDFELRFWAPDYVQYLQLSSDVASAVYDALAEAGISIPFPQRDLHIKSVEPEAARQLVRDQEKT